MDIKSLVDTGQELQFYTSALWKRKRVEVLTLDKHECQLCKQRGKYTRAEIVHHVKHLRNRPDLALCVRDPETGERQLVSLCRACHISIHTPQVGRDSKQSQKLSAKNISTDKFVKLSP